MSPDPPDSIDAESVAIAEAATLLPRGDQRAHIFLEARVDARLDLDSEGGRNYVETRTRGVAIAGPRSLHVTDPDPRELPALVRGAEPSPRRDVSRHPPLSLRTRERPAWRGRWSARIVQFDQKIWVGREEGVVFDRRRSCRLSVRVGTQPEARDELELALDPDDPRWPTLPDPQERPLASPPRGPFVGVFAPGAAGVMAHELFGHAREGDVALRRETWIASVDTTPGVPLTVIDAPARGRAGWRFDDEGTPSRSVVLIDQGSPAGLLLDRACASALRTESTGHGRRSSYMDPIRPRMGCTYIEQGHDDPDEVLSGTRDGVYLRRLSAGHTDPVTGRATFVVTDAARIVNGSIDQTFAPFVIMLDGRDVWHSIDAVARDLRFDSSVGSCIRDGQPLAVSVGGPTIRIGLVKVLA